MRTPDHSSPIDPLEAAVVALDQARPRELAERLLEAWRDTRDPGLADTYELLLREFSAPPLAGVDAASRAVSWVRRAEQERGEPLELPVLLAEPWSPEVDELDRLRLLREWTPDPLLATTLARRLRLAWRPRVGPEAREVWRSAITLLAEQGDPRQLPTLEWLRELPMLAKDAARARTRLAAVRPSALAAQQQVSAAKLARRARSRSELETRSAERLAAVHADPDRDEPRLVYADWLTSHGDPRGEFITLQIGRAHAGTPISGRERELLSRHGAEWAGAIQPVLGFGGARIFERGFTSVASVEVPELDGELVERAEWSTLRTLDGHVSNALARRGPLDHLRELYGFLQLERFVALRADNRLAAVECYECSLADPNLPLEIPLGLRTLLVRRALDDVLLRLLDSPAITGLERLGVYYGSPDSVAADHRERRSVRHRFELLRGRLPAHVRELCLFDDHTYRASRPWGWTLTFSRDELGSFSQLRVDWGEPARGYQSGAVSQLIELIGALGSGSLRKLMLGRFDDPQRTSAIERLHEWADASQCELSV